jgi:hypothetical protein
VLRVTGKCSALVKVSADLSDVFFGHSTWDSFTAMTRIYKHYQLNLKQVGIRGQAAREAGRHEQGNTSTVGLGLLGRVWPELGWQLRLQLRCAELGVARGCS